MIIKELFYGNFVSCRHQPISPVDGYTYRPDELTLFTITLDEENGGISFFTLGIRLLADALESGNIKLGQ